MISLCNIITTNYALSTMGLSLNLAKTIIIIILILDIVPIINIFFPHRLILSYMLGIWIAVFTVNVYISFVGITNMATSSSQPGPVIIGYFFVFFIAVTRLMLAADSYFVGIIHPQAKK